MKYADFQQITHSRSFEDVVPSVTVLDSTALDLRRVRLLGIALSLLNTDDISADQHLTLSI